MVAPEKTTPAIVLAQDDFQIFEIFLSSDPILDTRGFVFEKK